MVLSYYLFKFPYTIIWNFYKYFNKLKPVVFYCGDPLDYYIFEPVHKYLEHIEYVTDKAEVEEWLIEHGIIPLSLPVFPKVVIMSRHSTYKFPCKSITKIGMRHGAYHFKKMTSAENYNQFNLYLMTSEADVEAGKEIGVTCAIAVGFPKLDAALRGMYDEYYQISMKQRMDLHPQKKIILFTSTYTASGMSALKTWYNQLSALKDKYNVLVTLHPWIDEEFKQSLENTPGIILIKDYNAIPYIVISDVIVGDTSSILAECCALDKPMITFSKIKAKRSLDEIEQILNKISYRVTSFLELEDMIEHALSNPAELKQKRAEASALMFDSLDGKAGQRAAHKIKQLLIASDIT